MSNLIYEQMTKIQKEVQSIAKTETNEQQRYNFRSIDQVYASLHDLLAKHNVFTVPEILSSESEERPSKSGGLLITRILRIKYKFYAQDGSSFEAIVQGEGMDSGDKATNKAMSSAHKYLFLQVLSIPTSDKKDGDYESPEPQKDDRLISEAQRKRLFALMKSADMSEDEMHDLIREFKYEHTKDIKRSDYDEICNFVESYKPQKF